MHPRLRHSIILTCLLGAKLASAAPINLSSDQASAPARRDPGTGICATTIHIGQDGILKNLSEAIVRLDLGIGDAGIDGKVSQPYPTVNFRNNDGAAAGDYSTDENYFPFSANNMAMPMGDDKNLSLRARGYINIIQPGTYTFGVNAEKAFRLSVGGLVVAGSQAGQSGHFSQQVNFEGPGMYAIEVLHYVDTGKALLEVAIADGAQSEVQASPDALPAAFKLLSKDTLFSALTGASDCTECGSDRDCNGGGKGLYCGDNKLCQACNVSAHCGFGCTPCAADRPACFEGTCVTCTPQDSRLCKRGEVCREDFTCGPCLRDNNCPAGLLCERNTGTCVSPPPPPECAADNQKVCTDKGRLCNLSTGRCEGCSMDSQCQATDAQGVCFRGVCVHKNLTRFQGGCGITNPAQQGGTALLVFSGLCLLLLFGHAYFASSLKKLRVGGAFQRGRMRRRKDFGGITLNLLILCLMVGFPLVARGQDMQGAMTTPVSFNAQTFRPAVGPQNIITVEGTRTQGMLTPAAALTFDFSYLPLRLYDVERGEYVANTIAHMTTAHVQAGLGILKFWSLHLSLPVVLFQSFDSVSTLVEPSIQEPSVAGLGDLRLVTKLRILNNEKGGFGLAFVPQVSFPTGDGKQFRGDDAFGIEPRIALDYRLKNGTFFAVNAGFLARTADQEFKDVLVTHQVRYGAGAHIALPKGLGLDGEISGSTAIAKYNGGSLYSPLEGFLGARYTHRSGLSASVGGGGAFLSAVGTPQFRLFASIGWLPMERPGKRAIKQPDDEGDDGKGKPKLLDPDKDGLVGSEDECPLQVGPAENKGCPDTDQDNDGLVDRLDKCAKEAGVKENAGCPDTDADKDGVVDRLDKCPSEAGGADREGCPEPDTDKDGLVDSQDKCPAQAGEKDNAGCPDTDGDKDGVVDRLDKCADRAGPKDNGGCPIEYVKIEEGTIKLLKPIRFAAGKADLDPVSKETIEALTKAVQADPAIKKVEASVGAPGDKKTAKKLATARVKSLTAALVAGGLSKKQVKIKAQKGSTEDTVSEVKLTKGKVKAPKVKKEKKPKEKKAKKAK